MSFFETLRVLFPRSKAFRMIKATSLKKFITGLAELPDDVRKKTEQTYLNLFPDWTIAYNEWEKQFAVMFADEIYGDTRKGILKSLWQANTGGQSSQYLESLLQKVDPRIKVYENNPVKNPRDSNAVFACVCGYKAGVCGNKRLNCGFKLGDDGFIPFVIKNDSESVYDIPNKKTFWENYFFVCAGVVTNSKHEIIYCQKLQLDKKWRFFIEFLILKIKPVQTGALVFIQWI